MRQLRHVAIFVCFRLAFSDALKDCVEPIRFSKKDELTCSTEFALVPKAICDNNNRMDHMDAAVVVDGCETNRAAGTTYNSNYNNKNNHDGSNVCAFAVEGFFAEWRMLDAAFLTSGSCHASIAEGRFFAQDALRVFPDNHELVTVRMSGRDLLAALENRLVDYYVRGNMDSYPHTAGIKYELDLLQPVGQRIRNAKLLGFMCNWKTLDENASYMILTNSALADTQFATVALSKTGTGRGEAESLFLYATSVCQLTDNWHQMRVRHSPKIPLPSMVDEDSVVTAPDTPAESTTTTTTTRKRTISASV